MDNLDDSENNAKISDSAYSNSCSNSQSRRSHSSKSTHSGSNSSGSSGYGGNPSTSEYCNNNASEPSETRLKEKDPKKKKTQSKSPKDKLISAATQPEAIGVPPEPVKEFKVPNEEMIDDSSVRVVLGTSTGKSVKAREGKVKSVELRSSEPGSNVEKGAESMEICSMDMTSCPEETGSEPNDQMVKCMDVVPNRAIPIPVLDYFSCVISMHDGIVMHTTASITAVLGYPKEMWTGRSFLDFVHERDRNVFASQITSGLALPKNANGMPIKAVTQVNTTSSVVCRLRRYRSLSSGFNVKDRSTTYRPFQLKLFFKKLTDLDDRSMYLVVQATPFFSAYKTPYEVISKPVPFIIRHTANGNMEFVDPESVPYLGYLPHDLVDKNALQLYHPHDLDYLQQVYETTVREGSVPRCSPYRMMTQNGDYVKLETEWSSFINPWSKKLEFVIGKHHVVEGPGNPDVFQPPNPQTMFKLSEDDKAKTHCMRENIVRIMNEVLTKPAEMAKQQMTKRCQDIAALMETLIEETPKPVEDLRLDLHDVDNSYFSRDVKASRGEFLPAMKLSAVERDSVMLGGISPHHDFNDSKSSTDTPLSYNQLNYNDNLQRFFDSHQSCVFEEVKTNGGENIYGITDRVDEFGGNLSPIDRSPLMEDDRIQFPGSLSLVNQDYIPIRLTESFLRKHNAKMEKELVRMHRETRSCSRSEREKLIIENRQKKKEHLARCNAAFQPTSAGLNPPPSQSHGLKRSSKSSDTEPGAHKHQCTSPRQQRRWQATTTPTALKSTVVSTTSVSTAWPANRGDNMGNGFILGMGVPQAMPIINPVSTIPGILPIYYTPPIDKSVTTDFGESSQQQVPFQHTPIPCMMYGPTMYGQPFMYAPFNQQVAYDMHHNFVNQSHTFANNLNSLLLSGRNYEEAWKSNASKPKQSEDARAWRNPNKTEAPSHFSKQRGSESRSSLQQFNASPDAAADTNRRCKSKQSTSNNEEKTDGESSYYSFYSSFFKTESGSAEDSDNKKSDKDGDKARPWSRVSRCEQYSKKQRTTVPKRSMDPPWMEQVSVTSELIYRYKVVNKNLDEVLLSDKEKLKNMEQPPLVNEQLAQLYLDLQLEGVASRLSLEEAITSSSSSDEDGAAKAKKIKYSTTRKKHEYSRLVMIYEEDAPFPPPNDEPSAPSSSPR